MADEGKVVASVWYHRGLPNFDDDSSLCHLDDGTGTPINLVLATDYEALRKRCEAVEADAERWAWLRQNCGYSGSGPHNGAHVIVYYADAGDGKYGIAYTGPRQRVGIVAIDTAVDRAIAAAQEPSHG